MIAGRSTSVEVEGQLPGEVIEMGLVQSAEAQAHFISMFTDMYKDRRRAVIREYSTNALDAQIEAGYSGPIEVTLPNRMTPYLRIKDRGTGLDYDAVKRIYSQYGASTKRESNDFNGTFGIGCKAAMTYTSQFIVTSVKNGVRTHVVVSRHPKGASMQVVDTSSTTDPDGTEVMVEIKAVDQDEIKKIAAEFYRVWKPGTVLVDGKAPASVDGLRLTKDLIVTEGDDRCFVVSGNVQYPVARHKVAPGLNSCYGLIAHTPIGSVHFPADREGLIDTPETEATLAKIREAFTVAASDAVQKSVNAAKTPNEALRTFLRYKGMYDKLSEVTFHKLPMPGSYDLPRNLTTGKVEPYARVVQPDTKWYRSKANDLRQISPQLLADATWLVGWEYANWSGPMRDKLDFYCSQNGLTVRDHTFLATRQIPSELLPWVDQSKVIDWMIQIKPLKLPGSAGPRLKSNRLPGSYDFYVGETLSVGKPGAEIERLEAASYPIFYSHGNRYCASSYLPALKAIYGDKFVVVCLGQNRIDKFKRNVPGTKTAYNAVKDGFKGWAAKVPADTKKAVAFKDANLYDSLRPIDPAKVKDPALAEGARVCKIDPNGVIGARRVFVRLIGRDAAEAPFKARAVSTLTRYPLFSVAVLTKNPAHVYSYLNNAYTSGV